LLLQAIRAFLVDEVVGVARQLKAGDSAVFSCGAV
jgi:hypothetical protein